MKHSEMNCTMCVAVKESEGFSARKLPLTRIITPLNWQVTVTG